MSSAAVCIKRLCERLRKMYLSMYIRADVSASVTHDACLKMLHFLLFERLAPWHNTHAAERQAYTATVHS